MSNVKKQKGANLDNVFKEGILSHIAIKCCLDQEVENFFIHTNLEEYGPATIFVRVEYHNKHELYIINYNYESKDANTARSIFEQRKGTFYLPIMEELYKKVKNELDTEIFEGIEYNNIKVILLSNVKLREINELQSVKLEKWDNSSLVSTFNTSEASPIYQIKAKNTSCSKEFISRCFVFVDQINVNNLDKLIQKDLNIMHISSFVKNIRNYFQNWNNTSPTFEISKQDVVVLIMSILPLTNVNVKLEENFNCNLEELLTIFVRHFPLSILENTKSSVLVEAVSKFSKESLGLDIFSKPWESEVTNEEEETFLNFFKTKTAKDDFHKMKKLILKVTFKDLYYFLWKQRKLPLLIDYLKADQSMIEFVVKQFESIFNTLPIVLFYEKEFPKNLSNTTVSLASLKNYENFKNITLSLQEKEFVKLEELIEDNADSLDKLTPNAFLHLVFDSVTIGRKNQVNQHFLQRRIKQPFLTKEVLKDKDCLFISSNSRNLNIHKYLEAYNNEKILDKIFKFDSITFLHSDLSLEETLNSLKIVEEKSVHYVCERNDCLELIESIGSVSALRKYLTEYPTSEEDVWKIFNKKANIISGESGIGKTVYLNYIENLAPKNIWTFNINVKESFQELLKMNVNGNGDELLEFLIDLQLNNKHPDLKRFFKELLLTRLKSGNVVLFIDDFDEADLSEFMSFAKKLNYKICASVKPCKQLQLENVLNTLSLKLFPFGEADQKMFIGKFYPSISDQISFDEDFLQTPLYTYFSAEIKNNEDFIRLLGKFVEIKTSECNVNILEHLCELSMVKYFGHNFLKINSSINVDKLESTTAQLSKLANVPLIVKFSKNGAIFENSVIEEFLCAKYLKDHISHNKFKILYEKLLDPDMKRVKYLFDLLMVDNLVLHAAVLKNDLDRVKEILQNNKDEVCKKDALGRTVLETVITYHKISETNSFSLNIEIFQILINHFNSDKVLLTSLAEKCLKSKSFNMLDYILEVNPSIQILDLDNQLTLYNSVKYNLINILTKILTNNTSKSCINLFNKNKQTASKILKRLENSNKVPLTQIAAKCGHKEVFLKLWEYYGSNCGNVFHVAIENNQLEFVKYVYEHCKNLQQNLLGNDDKGFSPMFYAIKSGNLETVNWLLSKNVSKEDMLEIATFYGQLHTLETLGIEENINNLNKEGCTLLYYAILGNSLTVVNFLLSKKADCSIKNKSGLNSLHLACKLSLIDIVKSILNNSATFVNDVSDEDNFTALHYAMQNCDKEIVKILLSNNADAFAKDKNNNTVLHTAVKNVEICTLDLVKSILDLSNSFKQQRNLDNQTPFELALKCKENCTDRVKKEFGEIIELLK